MSVPIIPVSSSDLQSQLNVKSQPSIEILNLLVGQGSFDPRVLVGKMLADWTTLKPYSDIVRIEGLETRGVIKQINRGGIIIGGVNWAGTIETFFEKENFPASFMQASRLVTRHSDNAVIGIIFARDNSFQKCHLVPASDINAAPYTRSYIEPNPDFLRDVRRPVLRYGAPIGDIAGKRLTVPFGFGSR